MSLFLTAALPVDPQAGDKARSTLKAAHRTYDERPTQAPGWNEIETDLGGDLTGLGRREVPGNYTPTQKYTPAWLGKASTDYTTIVDSQVASSGSAAAREAAGQFGHGTTPITESIDPVIRDGLALGTFVFEAPHPPIQSGAGDAMQATPRHSPNGVAGMLATLNAKNAWQSSARLATNLG